MEEQFFHKALEIVEDVCVGCSHCIRVCPTEALRVRGGKARIHPEWCVDCGECYRVCPSRAIRVRDDDFKKVLDYKYRLLLVPSVFYAQFEKRVDRETINNIIGGLGFDEVCDVEQSVDLLVEEEEEYIRSADIKPVISSFCPAVTRLVQVRFPSLVDNIMRLLPPLELTAQYYKRKYREQHGSDSDLGIFYLTPCIGKIAAVKSPVGGYVSPINGVINMDYFYNKVYLAYKNKIKSDRNIKVSSFVSSKGILFPSTGGESSVLNVRSLAVDGLNSVIDILERVENNEIRGVDLLELRVCDESCAGGILLFGNKFIIAENLRHFAVAAPKVHELVFDYKTYCSAVVHMDRVEPRSLVKYDRDIDVAIKKMESARELRKVFPGIDCGACGAPSCAAQAEDVVKGLSEVSACLFLRTKYEKRGEIDTEEAIKIMEAIWGKDRFEKNKI
jgi:Na+-translocating ferredoxin:NAD+ oxidoreductase RNF subunit RnfB